MGGFDLFASMPAMRQIDWWQSRLSWLSSNIQISQFTTLLEWVPQHISACVPFLLGLIVLKNMTISRGTLAFILGLLASYSFSSSPLVFLTFALVLAFIILFNIKQLLADWKKSLVYLAIFITIFILVTWRFIFLYASHESGFVSRNLQLTVIEALRGGSPLSIFADKLLTILGFPLLASWMGVVEMGLSFILYLIWLVKILPNIRKNLSTTQTFLLAIFPPFYMLIIFLLEDRAGGGNFAMRGMLPVQVLIVFSGLFLLDELRDKIWKPAHIRWIFIYIFACFFIAQSLSSFDEIYFNAVDPMRSVINSGFSSLKRPQGDVTTSNLVDWPSDLKYIYWLNLNSPTQALIIEDGCPVGNADTTIYRLLERIRFLDLRCAVNMGLFPRDQDFTSPNELRALLAKARSYPDVLQFFATVEKYKTDHLPVYFIDRSSPPKTEWGLPVYKDDYVLIYRIQ
jgi:hypothetical protein